MKQIIGRTLGASRPADLYFASFTLPDFLNYLLAAGALSIVFIPIFVKYLENGQEATRLGGVQRRSRISPRGRWGIGIVLPTVFARPLTGVVAPGFTDAGDIDNLV